MKKLLIVLSIMAAVAVGLYIIWQVIKIVAYFVLAGIIGFVGGWFARKYYKI